MKAKQDKSPDELAVLACSLTLAGIKGKLLAAAKEWDDARKSWRDRGNHAAAAVCNTAAFELRNLARQCSESLPVSHAGEQQQ